MRVTTLKELRQIVTEAGAVDEEETRLRSALTAAAKKHLRLLTRPVPAPKVGRGAMYYTASPEVLKAREAVDAARSALIQYLMKKGDPRWRDETRSAKKAPRTTLDETITEGVEDAKYSEQNAEIRARIADLRERMQRLRAFGDWEAAEDLEDKIRELASFLYETKNVKTVTEGILCHVCGTEHQPYWSDDDDAELEPQENYYIKPMPLGWVYKEPDYVP